MFIEGITKYEVEIKRCLRNKISSLKIYCMSEPIYENEWILTENKNIKIIKFMQEGEAISGIIKCEYEDKNCAFMLKKSNESVKTKVNKEEVLINGDFYQIIEFKSKFPTHEIKIVENYIHGKSYLLEKTLAEIKKEIRNGVIGSDINNGNVIYNNDIKFKRNLYEIVAMDGSLFVESECLKIKEDNVHSLFLNLRNSNKEEMMKKSIKDIKQNLTNNNKEEMMKKSIKDIKQNLTTIFECVKKEYYLLLIKNIIDEIKARGFSRIVHFYLKNQEELYFISFIVFIEENKIEITTFLIKKNYNICKLFNYINDSYSNKDVFNTFLNIEDFNCKTFLIVNKGENFIYSYQLKKYKILYLIKHIFSNENICFKHNEDSFWIIMYILETISPFKWPGLIISPINTNMMYLLEGPYRYIVSSYHKLAINISKIYTNIGFLKGTSSDIYSKKLEKYIKKKLYTILSTKINSNLKFPIRIPNLKSAVEESILNYLDIYKVFCIFSIDKSYIFLPRAYIYNEDPIPLWIMLYNGEFDYYTLLTSRKYLKTLLNRLCLDRNIDQLKKVINIIKSAKIKYNLTDLLSIRNYEQNRIELKNYWDIFKQQKIINSCTCIEGINDLNNQKIYQNLFTKIDINSPKLETLDCKKNNKCNKITLIYYKKKLYYLISVENILGLIEQNFLNNEILCSIFAYFYIYDLPFAENNYKGKSKICFKI